MESMLKSALSAASSTLLSAIDMRAFSKVYIIGSVPFSDSHETLNGRPTITLSTTRMTGAETGTGKNVKKKKKTLGCLPIH